MNIRSFPGPRLLAFTLATAIAIPLLMRWVDDPLARFFYAYANTWWVAFFAAITNLANGFIWYAAALSGILIAAARRDSFAEGGSYFRRHRRAWLFMIAAMATSGLSELLIKFVIGRDRPRFMFADGFTADGPRFHPFRLHMADSSFPSGHTQSICSAMLALAVIYPPLRPLFLVTAALVSASRIVIGAHYASDVLGGVWLAVVAVRYWQGRFEADGALSLRDPPPLSASPPDPAPSN